MTKIDTIAFQSAINVCHCTSHCVDYLYQLGTITSAVHYDVKTQHEVHMIEVRRFTQLTVITACRRCQLI